MNCTPLIPFLLKPSALTHSNSSLSPSNQSNPFSFIHSSLSLSLQSAFHFHFIMAATEVEQAAAPLKYKTWVLKVPVDCQGCKKKVKRILQKIDGVYVAEIDLKQQRAKVIGNVDSQTLINKLVEKTRKHAELWPEDNSKAEEKKSGKGKSKEKQNNGPESSEELKNNNKGGDDEKEKGESKAEDRPSSSVKSKGSGGAVEITDEVSPAKESDGAAPVKESEGAAPAKESDGAAAVKSGDGGAAAPEEPKSEENKPETSPSCETSPAPAGEKKGGESGGDGNSGGGGSGGKKKKKKGRNGTPASTGHPSAGHLAAQSTVTLPANPIPPRHHIRQHPPSQTNHSPPGHRIPEYPAPPRPNRSPPRQQAYPSPAPQYATPILSYNTAYPAGDHRASYYASAPQNSYLYSYNAPPGVEMEPRMPDLDSHSSRPSDSFEFFSDENPNACSIM